MTVHSISLPDEAIAVFCERWLVTEFALFGSILRDDFGPQSDIDVLVTFSPDSQRTLLDEAQMELELEEILGRKVDMVSRSAIEKSKNWIRRQEILNTAVTLHRFGSSCTSHG